MERNRAYKILRRLADKTLPPEFRQTVRRWLASSHDAKEKEEAMQQIWLEAEPEPDANIRESLAATHRKIRIAEGGSSIQLVYRRLLRYAAILLLPLVTGVAVWQVAERQYVTPEMVECYIPNGKQRTLELPDGSQIQINAGTLLIYPKEFKGKNRTIYLAGEANFRVASDTEKPFIVRTGPLNVQVVGTKFNVESYPGSGRIVTTLETGIVKVYKEQTPDQAIVMHPDEQLTYNSHEDRFVSAYVEASDCAAWTQGELRFGNQSLREILVVLERHYDIQFRINPEINTSDLYTIKFKPNETIEDVLRIFTQIIGISYKKEGQTVLLFPKRKEAMR